MMVKNKEVYLPENSEPRIVYDKKLTEPAETVDPAQDQIAQSSFI